MKYFHMLPQRVNVAPLQMELRGHPGWNEHSMRREAKADSPHRDCRDLWVRYNHLDNQHEGYEAYTAKHDSVWLPHAATLPHVKNVCYYLLAASRGVRLGGVVVTQIPPGKMVYPHADTGWHPTYYNCKLYVPIDTNPCCLNHVWTTKDDMETVRMNQGEVWFMDNTVPHAVVNRGDTERTTLIVCIRVEP